MRVELDGRTILSEAEFHAALAVCLDLGGYYGRNLNALRDVLTGSVERPVALVWHDADTSRAAMPEQFKAIVAILEEVAAQDRAYGWDERFEVELA